MTDPGKITSRKHPVFETSPRFALSPGETLAVGLRRISLDQLSYAHAALRDLPLPVGVHECRKSLKRVRAVLRLVRDTVGERVYKPENIALRDAGRSLGPARDAGVMLETLDGMILLYEPGLKEGIFDGLKDELRERQRMQLHRVGATARDDVLIFLGQARARFANWPIEPGDPYRPAIPDEFSAIAPGVARVYRRGRRRMRDAYDQPSTVSFHMWRKRVRYLRYQMEVLAPVWPHVIGGLSRDLADLAEGLGAEHDLALLYELVDRRPSLLPDAAGRHLLLALLDQSRSDLQLAMKRVGERIYLEPPEVFVKRLGAYWSAWHLT